MFFILFYMLTDNKFLFFPLPAFLLLHLLSRTENEHEKDINNKRRRDNSMYNKNIDIHVLLSLAVVSSTVPVCSFFLHSLFFILFIFFIHSLVFFSINNEVRIVTKISKVLMIKHIAKFKMIHLLFYHCSSCFFFPRYQFYVIFFQFTCSVSLSFSKFCMLKTHSVFSWPRYNGMIFNAFSFSQQI